jgi:hypothetical protein
LAASETDLERDIAYVQRPTRAEFDRRLADWKLYLKENPPGYLRSGMNNEPFRRLLALGPGSIPWLVEELEDCDTRILVAVEVLLRADWDPENTNPWKHVRGKDECEPFLKWWPTARNLAPQRFEERSRAFRAIIANASKSLRRIAALNLPEWEDLTEVGLFGVPLIMERIRSGVADRVDFALMDYWTSPPKMVSFGVSEDEKRPELPSSLPAPPDRIKSADHWLQWWEKYRSHFWWLVPEIEEPK